MTGGMFVRLIHLHGPLSANASGVMRIPLQGATLVEIAATASNANTARLSVGTATDDDAYVDELAIGDSGVPVVMTPRQFNGVLADSLKSLPIILGKNAIVTWKLEYEGTLADETNEQQLITLTGTPVAGTFTLTFDGETTGNLAYNASAATVQAALRALASINGAFVDVTGPAGGPYLATFVGDLKATNVPAISGSAANLVDGSVPGVSIVEATPGQAAVNEVQIVTITGSPTGGDFTLSFGGEATGALAFNVSAADMQTALRALATVGGANLTVAGDAGGPYTVTFIGTLAGANQAMLVANGAGLTGGTTPTVTVAESVQGSVAVDEIQTVTLTNTPNGGTFTLTYGGQTTSALAYNASAATVQAALRALTSINGANVTVTGDAGGPYTVTFIGTLAGTNVALMTGSGASLTDDTNPGITIAVQATGVDGVAAANVDLQFVFLEG